MADKHLYPREVLILVTCSRDRGALYLKSWSQGNDFGMCWSRIPGDMVGDTLKIKATPRSAYGVTLWPRCLAAKVSNPPNCADPGGYRERRVWGMKTGAAG
jgi:hypothetical protein